VKNVLEVITLDTFLGVKQLKEVLYELGSHVDLQGTNFDGLVNNKLKEELVDTLEVGPCGIHLLFLINSCLLEAEVALLHVGQGTENVFLNHLHHLVEVGNNQRGDVFLVLKHLL
jgi:hypothetical protein